MPKLTKTTVDKLQPDEAPYFVWDGDLAGFGVRVFPSGRRVYYVDYYPREGTRKRMSIGAHGKLTTEEARTQARIILGGALKGEDPALERKTRRKSLTVNDLCDDYLDAARAGLILGRGDLPKKASTIETDESRISAHIRPLLGAKRVIDVTKADISKFIADVTTGKTAKIVELDKPHARSVVTGGSGAAARTTGLLGGIFEYAVSKDIRPDNPVRGVRRPADKKRQRRLTPPEYKRLGDALRASDDQIEQATAGIWLLALTGARISEIETFRRSLIQADGRTAVLDDSKAGRSLRPLSRPALDILAGLDAESDYVLPSVREPGGHYGGLDNAIERIMARANLPGVTAHTLRHSFASVGNDLGYTIPTIDAIIGHVTQTSSAGADYIHTLDDVLIAAADKIAAEVLRQIRTGKPLPR